MYVTRKTIQLVFIAHNVIERFGLPELARVPKDLIGFFCCERLPRLKNVGEFVFHCWTNQYVDMVGHDYVAAQNITITIEMKQGIFHDLRYGWISKRTISNSIIKMSFEF